MRKVSIVALLVGLLMTSGLAGTALADDASQQATLPFSFGTYSQNKLDLGIKPADISSRYGYVWATYIPPTSNAPFKPTDNDLFSRIARYFVPTNDSFSVVLDVNLKESDGAVVKLNTIPIASFSYDGKTASYISQNDYLKWNRITPNFALNGNEQIDIRPHILFTHRKNVNIDAVNSISSAVQSIAGPTNVVSKFSADKITVATGNLFDSLVTSFTANSVTSNDVWHLSYVGAGSAQQLNLNLANNGAQFGTIQVALTSLCSIFTADGVCTSDYAKIATHLNLNSVSVWQGSSLKTLVDAGVPRPPAELTTGTKPDQPAAVGGAAAVPVVGSSTDLTCSNLYRGLQVDWLGLTQSDAAIVMYNAFYQNGSFANTKVTTTACYQQLVQDWNALGIAPQTTKAARDIDTDTVMKLATDFSNALSGVVPNRSKSFDILYLQFVGGTANVDVSGVDAGVVRQDPFDAPALPAKSVVAQLKNWQIATACWVDATDRKTVNPSADYVAQGLISASAQVAGKPVPDPRELYAELHFENVLDNNSQPSIKKVVLRALTMKDFVDDAALKTECKTHQPEASKSPFDQAAVVAAASPVSPIAPTDSTSAPPASAMASSSK